MQDKSTVHLSRVIIPVLLALFIPPFAYLYLQRPVLFFIALLLGLLAIPPGLHHPWIWLIFTLGIASHSAFTVIRAGKPDAPRWYAQPIGFLACILLMTGTAAGIRVVLLDVLRVSSGSMEPALKINDLLVVPKWTNPVIERGRIYTFRFDGDASIYVKRLIGMPGDLVTMRGNHLELNGLKVTHEGKSSGFREQLDGHNYVVFDLYKIKPFRRDWRLGVDQYFFLGDNRSNSIDSRIRGSVSRANIIGEAKRLPSWW